MDDTLKLLLEIKDELHENSLETSNILESMAYVKKKINDHDTRLTCLENENLVINHTYKIAKIGIGFLIGIGTFVMSAVAFLIGR